MKSVIINTVASVIIFAIAFAWGYTFSLKHNPCLPCETIVETTESVDTVATYPDGNFLDMSAYQDYTDIMFNFNGTIELDQDLDNIIEIYEEVRAMQLRFDELVQLADKHYEEVADESSY